MADRPDSLPPDARPLGGQAYLAAEGRLDELLTELDGRVEVTGVHERLVLTQGPGMRPAWAANVWCDPLVVPVTSIGAAARALKGWQRNWALHSVACHRRAALVVDKLPHVSARPLRFGDAAPRAPLGAFTLLDEHTLLAAGQTSSPVPDGAWTFVEDRDGPPNRAYLKLWEALTRLGVAPTAGERCLELGASPGGWTHVLAGTGAEVTAVDKAPLDPRVAARPNVVEHIGSAFGLGPRDLPAPDWLFSDVICYPERLLGVIERWRAAGCERFVVTLKFQGDTDHAAAAAFADLPGGRLVHLHHNKHELTWLCVPGVTDTDAG